MSALGAKRAFRALYHLKNPLRCCNKLIFFSFDTLCLLLHQEWPPNLPLNIPWPSLQYIEAFMHGCRVECTQRRCNEYMLPSGVLMRVVASAWTALCFLCLKYLQYRDGEDRYSYKGEKDKVAECTTSVVAACLSAKQMKFSPPGRGNLCSLWRVKVLRGKDSTCCTSIPELCGLHGPVVEGLSPRVLFA